LGFEDIAIDQRHGNFFCLIEALEDIDGVLRSFVVEYQSSGSFLRCSRLETRFQKENKGFEGLTHVWLKGHECLYALSEGNFGASAKHGGGKVYVFTRTSDGDWKASHQIRLPKQAEFEDYAALAYRDGQIAIVSQESARVWVAQIDEQGPALVPDSDAVYRFPSKSYGNVEGIAWLSKDTLVAVSDRKKKQQPDRCTEKDQAIHLFRIPAG
jgi:uncharacterized protein YjiK